MNNKTYNDIKSEIELNLVRELNMSVFQRVSEVSKNDVGNDVDIVGNVGKTRSRMKGEKEEIV